MTDNLQTINVSQLRKMTGTENDYSINDDFVMSIINGTDGTGKEVSMMRGLCTTFRLDGYILLILKKGRLTVDLNLYSYELTDSSILVTLPGNLIKIAPASGFNLKDLQMTAMFIDKDFVSGIRLDFYNNSRQNVVMLNNPCVRMNETQLDITDDYIRIIKKAIAGCGSKRQEVVCSILTSLSYLAEDSWNDYAPVSTPQSVNVRLNRIFDRFIALVTEYHCSQRGVAFYSEKMNLTPKYLSMLVRQASGRSAPEWISDFVILEAKNMLRYSNRSIKEIVAYLNFPSQPVFYNFFKSRTGLTPSQYRNQ